MARGPIGGIYGFGRDASILKHEVKKGTTERMIRFARPFAWLLATFLTVVVVDASIGIVNPLIFREIINNGILKSNSRLVIEMAALAALLGITDAGLGLLQAFLSSSIGARVVLSLRTKLFAHIQQMPLAFFTRTQAGALISRLNNDVGGAQSAFTDILSNVVGNLVTVSLVLAAMFVLSWQITVAALALVPLFFFPARYWGRKLQAIVRESLNLTAEMNNLMTERFNVSGAQLAKLFGRPEQEAHDFEAKAARVSAISVTRTIYGRMLFTSFGLLSLFATTSAYGWGGLLAISHQLDVGTVVAFVAYLQRLYGPLAGLSNIQVNFMTALVSFERVFEILDLPPSIKDRPNAVDIQRGPARIEFDHVSFRYPGASELAIASLESAARPDQAEPATVLHDISFIAEPGQMVALVGPSGAGKTTITQLIPRLYDVKGGSIKVNGVDVRDAKQASLHERIGVVTQDAHLFHDTIRANLLYAKPNASDAEIEDALREANLMALVRSLPNGIDTVAGQRGYRFSGGEKQRLAIARVLLKAPDIVILDEATSHLDSRSEAAIQEAFEVALRGRTSIVIAHRLSTILKADQILVIQNGRIVERGRHAELVTRNGLYSELFRSQAFAKDGASSETETDLEISEPERAPIDQAGDDKLPETALS
ncbi:MAG TPA: ABC transporter ATP-binding protein [Alphaproteobacteria bacterium]|nr:ABC transporter ATP-binding protein [Alphaproteobacteria bacterium]